YCKGVLHHTPDPRRVFMELARVNAERLFVLVYTRRNLLMLIRKYLRTYQYPYWLLTLIAQASAVLLYIPANLVKRVRRLERELTVGSLTLFVFDYLSPRYQSVHSYSEVQQWFAAAGYSCELKREDQGVAVLGTKARVPTLRA